MLPSKNNPLEHFLFNSFDPFYPLNTKGSIQGVVIIHKNTRNNCSYSWMIWQRTPGKLLLHRDTKERSLIPLGFSEAGQHLTSKISRVTSFPTHLRYHSPHHFRYHAGHHSRNGLPGHENDTSSEKSPNTCSHQVTT